MTSRHSTEGQASRDTSHPALPVPGVSRSPRQGVEPLQADWAGPAGETREPASAGHAVPPPTEVAQGTKERLTPVSPCAPWSVGALQLDVITVEAGNGHVQVYLPSAQDSGALAPDAVPEGEHDCR